MRKNALRESGTEKEREKAQPDNLHFARRVQSPACFVPRMSPHVSACAKADYMPRFRQVDDIPTDSDDMPTGGFWAFYAYT